MTEHGLSDHASLLPLANSRTRTQSHLISVSAELTRTTGMADTTSEKTAFCVGRSHAGQWVIFGLLLLGKFIK